MYALSNARGFILRLMIDEKFQRRGYGKAAMVEVIRRLKLHPEVERIATSHDRKNEALPHDFMKVWDSLIGNMNQGRTIPVKSI